MMLLDALLASVLLMGTGVTVHAAPAPASGAQPIPPKQDPWYTAPKGFEKAAPGDVLRSRTAPGNLTSVIGNCSAAYNVLYRTTDSNNKPTWAVTTLLVPPPISACSLPRRGDGSLLSYQIPYDSANLDQSPSYQLYEEPPADIADSLGKGWFVNVPDYEGPLASYTAGVISGYATLDSVRAVRAASLGISQDARYALWGYSGGALASEWAAELQQAYAPELKFSGAALGGLTPNITSVLETVNAELSASLIPEGITGLITQHAAARKVILSHLKTRGKYNKNTFFIVRDDTYDEAALEFAFQNIGSYFKGGLSFLQAPGIQAATNADGIMGRHGQPQMPIFAYKAIGDEISPIEDTDALLAKFCSKGATILYERNTVGGHVAEATNGEPAANEFLDSVLGGTFSMTGCETRNVTIKLSTSPERRGWAPNSSNRLR